MTRAALSALHRLLDQVAALDGASGLPAADQVERLRLDLGLPALPVASSATPLTCPRCGATSHQLGEFVYRCWPDVRAVGPVVEVNCDRDEIMPEAVMTPERGWCDVCNEEFDLPEGVLIDWRNA